MGMPKKIYRDVTDADFLMSEGPGRISRDQVILGADAAVKVSGLVLGQITATGKYVRLNLVGADGSQNAAVVLMLRQPESAVDQRAAVVSRIAELRGLALTWPAGITDNQKKAAEAQLAAKMLIVRY